MEDNSSLDPTVRNGEVFSFALPLTREFSFPSSPKPSKRSKSSFSSVTAPCGEDTDDEGAGWESTSILVGYAFGSKKMSTMSIIMAEASQVPEDSATWDEPTLLSSYSSSRTIAATSTQEDEHTNTSLLENGLKPYSTLTAATHDNPLRVSFVPVDLNFPLEEQHGGNFDAILHKLTEDILVGMSVNSSARIATPMCDDERNQTAGDENSSHLLCPTKRAVARLNRLVKYKKEHPWCCLVDPPEKIKMVLSRADIANELSRCLKGVTTKSGMSVSTPNFFVCAESDADILASRLDERSFRFPLISKPLTAAGTPDSHKMVIFLNSKGLLKAVQAPCLLQEYANHDAILYKVYVLGDEVFVFQRRSLPNLPVGKNSSDELSYVAFDSQKEYPDLSVFCTTKEGGNVADVKRQKVASHSEVPSLTEVHRITAEEINPVVCALQKVFCLGLFGFDVIITRQQGWMELLVIDVNYFPSYKEVKHFPRLLAQYLARYTLNSRLQSS